MKKNKIYRYIALDSFLDILQTNKLTMFNPSKWEDPFENKFLVEHINTIIDEKIEAYGINKDSFQIFERISELRYLMNNTFSQSWTRIEESDAFWRIYNYDNKTIRISTDMKRVSSIYGLEAKDIIYSDTLPNFLEEPRDFMYIKRKAFEHEKEIRLSYTKITEDKDLFVFIEFLKIYYDYFIEMNGLYLDEEKESELIYGFDYNGYDGTIYDFFQKYEYYKSDIIKLPIKIDEFILDVMVSPFAPEWYCNTVEDLCNNYNIIYVGKSELYNFYEDDGSVG